MKQSESRRERLRREGRQEILTAARSILSAEGVAALNMRAVAARMGCSQSLIYAHFAAKSDLLAELAREGLARLGQAMAGVLAVAGGTWAERIRDLGRTYRRFALEEPDLFGLNFGEAGAVPVADPPATFGLLRAAVEGGVAAGEFRPMDPGLGATVAWALVHGVVALERAGQLSADAAPAVLEAAVSDLLRSWAVGSHV